MHASSTCSSPTAASRGRHRRARRRVRGRSSSSVDPGRGQGARDPERGPAPRERGDGVDGRRRLARPRLTFPSSPRRSSTATCDHVSGSRLLGGSSELHGGFDEWAPARGQLVHHRVHQLALRRAAVGQPERVSRDPHRRAASAPAALAAHDDRARDDRRDAPCRHTHGRSSRRTSTRARRGARTSRCGGMARATCRCRSSRLML